MSIATAKPHSLYLFTVWKTAWGRPFAFVGFNTGSSPHCRRCCLCCYNYCHRYNSYV